MYLVYTLLNEIGQGSTRISEIVGALKSYSYLGQAPVQSVNIHEGIDNTLVILRNKLKTGITVHREYDLNLRPIVAYGSELNQVWTNLLDNAADALNGKGEIIIRTKHSEKSVQVEIEDNGPGIPKEIQSRIFDPFFTTKELGKGTGLGLSTSYSIIVEKHNGEISIESKPGQTCFTIVLPINLPTNNKISSVS
jgi:signal transduction histidine kinase